MPANKKPGGHVVGIGGSVMPEVRDKIYQTARKKGMTPSKYIGELLTEHAKGLEGVWKDPNQGELPLK